MTDLERLRSLRFQGAWQMKDPHLPMFVDIATGTSFVLQVGESLGEALDRLKARYGETGGNHDLV